MTCNKLLRNTVCIVFSCVEWFIFSVLKLFSKFIHGTYFYGDLLTTLIIQKLCFVCYNLLLYKILILCLVSCLNCIMNITILLDHWAALLWATRYHFRLWSRQMAGNPGCERARSVYLLKRVSPICQKAKLRAGSYN